MRALLIGGLAASVIAAMVFHMPAKAEDARMVPPPATDATPADGPQTVVLSGGCFWGVQGRIRACEGCAARGGRLCGRSPGYGAI